MLNSVNAKLQHRIITKDQPNYDLKKWIQPRFTNVGEAPVEIEGVVLGTGDTFDASIAHYPVTSQVSIKFTGEGIKKMVVNYGVLIKNC